MTTPAEQAAPLGAFEAVPERPRSRFNPLRTVRRYPLGVIGGSFVLVLAIVAVFAPLIAPYNPRAADFGVLERSSSAHLLGTDRTGRDVFSRVVWGARTSLAVGLIAATFGTITATTMGLIAGYFQRWPDYLIQRGGEVLAMIPT